MAKKFICYVVFKSIFAYFSSLKTFNIYLIEKGLVLIRF